MTTTTTPNLSVQNYFSTTLSAGITSTDTTIYLSTLPTGTEGFLVIDPDSSSREIIFYNAKGANFVTVPSVSDRGRGGTSAVSHSSGATVKCMVVAEYWEALQDGTAFAVGGIGASAYADGWAPILGVTPNTVTYNGNRNYDLVFNSTDLTDTLSPGMKLKLTRTVAAPDQCADLESGSTQYFNKTSPAGMTFTDDFTVSAWVKLESYAQMAVASRYNGTSGWLLFINANGQVAMNGYNGGASNVSGVTSYASLPLNKWVHIAAQLDMSAFTATTTTSYVMFDGVDVPASVSRGGTNPTALVQAGSLEIGGSNGGANPFDGKIAQVAIFNAKVTQATMRTYMSQGLSGSETSLISAYSLDNAITDLNTTNANNLTAQGGAAATNADSPFANAVTAGLEEYAEINSVTFSTNTTVNVRVPDTCMIPTSGGITASYYAVGAYPYGLPYFTKVLGYAQLGSNFQTASTSAVQVPGLSLTTYIPKNARVKISYHADYGSNGAAAEQVAGIWLGTVGSGTRLNGNRFTTSVAMSQHPIEGSASYYAIADGTQTFNLSYQTSSGAATVVTAATLPAFIQVELV